MWLGLGWVLALAADAAPAAPAPTTAPAPAPTPVAAPAATITASATERPHRTRLGLGAELGEPISATVAYFVDKLSVGGAIGTGTLYGPGLSVHVDCQYEVARLVPEVALRVGLGGRYYDQHYQPASVDELPQSRWGVRASAAVALERPDWQVYGELAPGVDLHRSASCNYFDGVNSVCPHVATTPVFVQFVVGARWFLPM
jgi:hypothetical protein